MHFASMSLGIFDFLIDWLTKFLMWIVGWVIDKVMDLISGLLYELASSVLYLVDLIQLMFRKLCGMDTIWIDGTKSQFVDPVITVLTNDSVLQTLLALSIVAVAMVIIASIIQIIRTEFSTEGSKNTKGQIFGKALKSLLMFAVVPVSCVGGIMLSNVLLRTIDTATSGGSQSTMGAQIAVSALASAKKSSCTDDVEQKFLTVDEEGNLLSGYNYRDTDDVRNYYDLGECNFFILIGSAVMAMYILITASFGLIMRIYYVAIYFIVSPPVVGLMPLTESPFTTWRKAFIGQVLGAYGTVVTLNLMFQLMPIVNNIDLFPTGHYGNDVAHLLFTLTALFMMKDLPKKLADLIGAQDASEGGAGMAKQVAGTAMKIGTVAAGGAGALAMKGLGAATGGIASKMPVDSKRAKTFGAISNSIGGIGNKLGQRAKGTVGGALNKAIGFATGGDIKGIFSDERNYDKALDAKDKKAEANEKLLKSGGAGVGLSLASGISRGAKNVKKSIENKRYEKASAKIDKQWDAIGNDSSLSDEQREKEYNKILKKSDDEELRHERALNSSGALRAFATGGASIHADNVKLEENRTALGNVVGDMKSSYFNAGEKVSPDNFGKIKKYLKEGNALGASNGIEAMINALNSIAEKSEAQKDLLLQLTNMKKQVDSAPSNKAGLNRLASSEAFDATKDGTVANRIATVHEQVSNSFNITSDFNVSNSVDNMDSKLKDLATQISSKTKQDVDGLKNQLLKSVKEELEKIKGKKK